MEKKKKDERYEKALEEFLTYCNGEYLEKGIMDLLFWWVMDNLSTNLKLQVENLNGESVIIEAINKAIASHEKKFHKGTG